MVGRLSARRTLGSGTWAQLLLLGAVHRWRYAMALMRCVRVHSKLDHHENRRTSYNSGCRRILRACHAGQCADHVHRLHQRLLLHWREFGYSQHF